MKDSIVPTAMPTPYYHTANVSHSPGSPGGTDSICATLQHGEIALVESDSCQIFGTRTDICSLAVTIYVGDPRFYTDTRFRWECRCR